MIISRFWSRASGMLALVAAIGVVLILVALVAVARPLSSGAGAGQGSPSDEIRAMGIPMVEDPLGVALARLAGDTCVQRAMAYGSGVGMQRADGSVEDGSSLATGGMPLRAALDVIPATAVAADSRGSLWAERVDAQGTVAIRLERMDYSDGSSTWTTVEAVRRVTCPSEET